MTLEKTMNRLELGLDFGMEESECLISKSGAGKNGFKSKCRLEYCKSGK